MANTYAGTASNQCLEKRALFDGEANGDLHWSGSAPAWSADNELATWDDIAAEVALESGHPTGNRCPNKAAFEAHVQFPPTILPDDLDIDQEAVETGPADYTVSWTNPGSANSSWDVSVAWEVNGSPTGLGNTVPSTNLSVSREFQAEDDVEAEVFYLNDAGAGPSDTVGPV